MLQVRSGSRALCVPRPLGPDGAVSWSRKQRRLTVRWSDDRLGDDTAPRLREQLCSRGFGVIDGFLSCPEADDTRAEVRHLCFTHAAAVRLKKETATCSFQEI